MVTGSDCNRATLRPAPRAGSMRRTPPKPGITICGFAAPRDNSVIAGAESLLKKMEHAGVSLELVTSEVDGERRIVCRGERLSQRFVQSLGIRQWPAARGNEEAHGVLRASGRKSAQPRDRQPPAPQGVSDIDARKIVEQQRSFTEVARGAREHGAITRHALGNLRQDLSPQPIAPVARVLVAFIIDPRELAPSRVRFDFRARHVEQRADEGCLRDERPKRFSLTSAPPSSLKNGIAANPLTPPPRSS